MKKIFFLSLAGFLFSITSLAYSNSIVVKYASAKPTNVFTDPEVAGCQIPDYYPSYESCYTNCAYKAGWCSATPATQYVLPTYNTVYVVLNWQGYTPPFSGTAFCASSSIVASGTQYNNCVYMPPDQEGVSRYDTMLFQPASF